VTLPDIPIVFTEPAQDWLKRGPSVRALQRMLSSPSLGTPPGIGIYSGWGTGKTSVMRTLEAALAAPERLMLWFDPLRYCCPATIFQDILAALFGCSERLRDDRRMTDASS